MMTEPLTHELLPWGCAFPESGAIAIAPETQFPTVDWVDTSVVRARGSKPKPDPESVEVIAREFYGESVIIIAPPSSQWSQWPKFLERARQWWQAGAQLSLVEPPPAKIRQKHEAMQFNDMLRAWGAEGIPVPPKVQVTFGKLEANANSRSRAGAVAKVVKGQTFALSATIGRRAIAFALAGATDAGEKWTDQFQHPIVMRDGDSVAEVVLVRPLGSLKARLNKKEQENLAEANRRWREIDQVVLDILCNNAIENGLDESGHAFASYDAILDARGTAKKTKGGFSAGHRPEDREIIHHSILRLVTMGAGVTRVNEKTRRGRLPPAIVAHDYEIDLVTGAVTGVEYELGKWIEILELAAHPRAPVKALQYHVLNEQLEQRLARLLVNLTFPQKDRRASRLVREVLAEINQTVDMKKPGRTLERFNKAMNRLKTDGVIENWSYSPNLPFEARGFVEDWLNRQLVVVGRETRALQEAAKALVGR